ncbi:MAG: V-type ATP synthase subunit D [Deltaproteobacteria bacterium]|nr:V-type ATP synthase subunit D [Deltaproteobacteria bacterium]
MAKIALNKGALQRERDQLRLYQRLLPSLDLKRRQLTVELDRAQGQLARDRVEVERLGTLTGEQLPMLANPEIDLSGLVHMESVRIVDENVVGVRLPLLKEVICTARRYSMIVMPHWVDVLVDQLKQMAELRVRVEVAAERVRRLDRAVRRTTQRVNLFEKILIPTAKKNIKYIRIFLGDAERAAVVRSKIAKARYGHEWDAVGDEGGVR